MNKTVDNLKANHACFFLLRLFFTNNVSKRHRPSKHDQISRSRCSIRRVKCLLFCTAEYFMRPSFVTANTHKVKVIKIMGNDIVHGINITLTTNAIPVEDVHGGTETGNPFGVCIIFGWFPVANECIMSRRLTFLYWCHPSPNGSLESQGGILFNVLRMVQQILLEGLTSFSIVVVPETTNKRTYSEVQPKLGK